MGISTEERIKQLWAFWEAGEREPFVLYALATEYKKSDLAKAEELFVRLKDEFPDYPGTYYHLALHYADTARPALAEAVFLKGIEVCQSQTEWHLLAEIKAAYANFIAEQ